MPIKELSKKIYECKKCPLWKTRNIPLIGDGSTNSKIILIGEAPGYHEDLKGKAFIGNAGKILDQLLDIIKIKRSQIYITNILKCHPPYNQNPTQQSINSCLEYLFKQLRIIKPKIILTLGKYATEVLFSKIKLKYTKISEIHGKLFEIQASYGLVKIIPLYHPATACYNPSLFFTMQNDIKKHTKLFANFYT
jgi:DNA polymerase